jgi:phosphoglycerate dehydrogenase-like enzyme
MSRIIGVVDSFQTEAHKKQMDEIGSRYGFTFRYYKDDEEALQSVADCEILYSHSDPAVLRAAKNLKWFCCDFAGVDKYLSDDVYCNADCILTNSNVYGVTIAEHVVMVTLMLLRRMPEYQQIVGGRGWSNQLPIRSIRDNEFTILGTGDIGNQVARLMRGMGAAKIVGVSRSGKAREGIYDEVYPISELNEVLKTTKILVMALPGTAETIGILSRERIALLPEDAYVINVGRGTAIDQAALKEALDGGKIAGAALDVMDPEPLPKDHPLWDTKNLILTPHVSGNMTLGYTRNENVRLFCEDLANYAAGRPLQGLVDRKKGY